MKSVPGLDLAALEPVTSHSTVEPSFLGCTAASWLARMATDGPVFRLDQDGREVYVICGHEADLTAWRSPDDWLYGPPSSGGNFFFAELGEQHVTQLDGEAHRRMRKLILPAFGVAAVTRDLAAVAELIETGLASWRGRSIDMHPALSRLVARALNISQLKSQLAGTDIDHLVTFEEGFIAASSLDEPDRRRWYATDYYSRARKVSFDYFNQVVAERESGVTRGDSLDLVIERAARSGSPPLDQGELFSLTYLLSVAGVGNIANILCAAMWALAEYPGWLEQLDDELGDFKPLDLKQGVGRFPILRAVISEVERCYLPAPVIPKMTATEINFMGYRIPAGVDILQLHGLAHFQADRYDDPLSFRPDRWLVGDASRANAFGGGIHLCLGMGVTRLYVPLVLALLARDHSWATKEPPRLVPQLADLPFSPETTRFDAALT